MKTILFLLLSASAMLAQVVPGRYILELSGDPAAVAAIQQGARSSARTAAIAARRTAVRQSQASARAGARTRLHRGHRRGVAGKFQNISPGNHLSEGGRCGKQ